MKLDALSNRDLMYRLLLLVLLVLCSYWIFIDTYRINAFNIVPHDDYATYLLHILGEDGGNLPGAPFVYRLFSVAVAAPFFYVLPFYNFTLLENVDVTYLRAVEALAMVSYLSMLASSALVYLTATRRFGGAPSSGVIGSLATLLIMQYSGYKGVDPVGILLVGLLIYYSRSPALFGILVFLSVGFNEKISLIMAILMVSRFVFVRDKEALPYAILSVSAFALYLFMRMALDAPGNEHQLEVNNFLINAWQNVLALFSLKRFVLVVLPISLLGMLYLLAAAEFRTNVVQYRRYFAYSDIFALLGLFLVTLGVGMRYGIGRVVMFSLPLYLPLAAIQIEKIIQRERGKP